MHEFAFGEEQFGIPDPELGFSDERQVTLGELVDLGARFRYTYDFGDNWEHEILVEDLLDPDPEIHYPILVAAKEPVRQRTAAALGDTRTSSRSSPTPVTMNTKEMLEWLGLDNASEFDPAAVPTDGHQRRTRAQRRQPLSSPPDASANSIRPIEPDDVSAPCALECPPTIAHPAEFRDARRSGSGESNEPSSWGPGANRRSGRRSASLSARARQLTP